jgi:general secretion pathway protein F
VPAYAYRAAERSGATAKGLIEAPTPAAARAELRQRGLLPLSVEPANDRGPALGSIQLPRLGRRKVTARQLATLTRQIATLVGSDIPVEEALRLVAAQSDAPGVTSVLTDVRGAILDGRSFASALGQHPAAFPEFYRASVAAGEHSGKLSFVLNHLAQFVETRHANAQKLQLALLYPALLATVSVGVIVLLMVYVVPDIVRVFVSRGAELPLLTRALIALSSFLQDWGLALLVGLAVGAFAFGRWVRVPANRLRLDRMFTERRPFRRFSRQHNAARFAGSLATLVESAVPLVEALHAAAAVTPNRFVQQKALQDADRDRRERRELGQARARARPRLGRA